MIRSIEQLRIHEFEIEEHNIYICFADVSDIDIKAENIRRVLSKKRICRIDEIKKETAKQLSAGAELMLVNAVRKKLPSVAVPVKYESGEYGKPYFIDIENAYFSLSHSGKIAACAISDTPVGVDVQSERRPNMALAKRFFSEREYAEVNSEPEIMFNRIWTRKEAAAKADGRGIAIGLRGLDVIDSKVKHSGRLYLTFDIPSPWKGYYMAVSKLIGAYQEPDRE